MYCICNMYLEACCAVCVEAVLFNMHACMQHACLHMHVGCAHNMHVMHVEHVCGNMLRCMCRGRTIEHKWLAVRG